MIAAEGGSIARDARKSLETKTGKPVVTHLSAKAIKALKESEDE